MIELDGSPHREQRDCDAGRTDYLSAEGYRVLRFWDGAVESDPERVLGRILDALRLKQAPRSRDRNRR